MLKRLTALLTVLAMLILPALAEESELTAAGYVYISCGAEGRWYPLPEEEAYEVTLRWVQADGELCENVISITPQGAVMASSTCDNQDCVGQGEVTLDNKELRILGNWIICLPHQVTIELFSRDELLAMLGL